MRTRKLVAVACVIALGALPAAVPQVEAGTTTANLAVSASVAGSCTVGAASLAFGPYVTTAADQAQATVTVTCTVAGLSPFITLNTTATGTRTMANGGSSLTYFLCEDNNNPCTTPITSTTHFAVAESTTGAANTINGLILAGQSGLTGNYSDTVTMTLNF